MNNKILILLITIFCINANQEELIKKDKQVCFVEIAISQEDEQILKNNSNTKYIYITPDLKEILQNISKNKDLEVEKDFKSLLDLSDSDVSIADSEKTISSIENFLDKNQNYACANNDLNNLKEYNQLLKNGDLQVVYESSINDDSSVTKKSKRKLKVYKKNIKFKKNINIKGDTIANKLFADALVLDGSPVAKLKIHGQSPNTEMEFGIFVAQNGANPITFAIPFKNIPAVIMNTSSQTTVTITQTGFSVSTPSVNVGHTYGWIAIGAI